MTAALACCFSRRRVRTFLALAPKRLQQLAANLLDLSLFRLAQHWLGSSQDVEEREFFLGKARKSHAVPDAGVQP